MALDQTDLDAIQSMIGNAISTIMNDLGNLHGEIGSVRGDIASQAGTVTGNIISSLDGIHQHLDTLGTSIDEYAASVGSGGSSSSSLFSLNGNGCEFKDGDIVNVNDRIDTFTVLRSYMTLIDSNSYTIAYDLESQNGLKVSCPESLLTLYTPSTENP